MVLIKLSRLKYSKSSQLFVGPYFVTFTFSSSLRKSCFFYYRLYC